MSKFACPIFCFHNHLKDELSDLRQFWASETPLEMMKNAFYLNLKALSVLKTFEFSS